MRLDVREAVGVLSLLVVAALAGPAWGESINQSRLRFTAHVNQSLPVTHDELADLCRDEDGCSLTLLVSDADETWVDFARFFLNDQPLWATTENQNSSDNNNAIALFILDVSGGGHTCVFTDGDGAGTDNALGFKLDFFGPGGSLATCIMTVID